MRKSLDSHYTEEVVYFANEGAETKPSQIRPSLNDFKIEKVYNGVYALTPKFKIDQKPGEERPYYSFVKVLLEFEEQLMRSAEDIPHTVYFVFPFPKGEITITEVDEELGELADNTDSFENTMFNWVWKQSNKYGKEVNIGVLAPSLVITEDGISGSTGDTGARGYFSLNVDYRNSVPFINVSGYVWGA